MKRAIVLLALLALAGPSLGADESEGVLNRLLAPGPLMKGHQALESSDCLKCHEVGKGISVQKCLACHKGIRAQVEGGSGFHGLTKETCIQCHSDHKGRENDTTKIDQKTFEHAATGFRLEGKHAALQCTQCHTAKRTDKATRKGDTHFLGAKTSCVGCHKKDDVHHFTGKWAKFDCGKCHGLKTWRDALKFDHAQDTRFALEGKHAEIKCASCHKDGKYVWPQLKQAKCLSCHEDFHKKNLSAKFAGGRCDQCHGQTSWKLAPFDHKVTGYPLRGSHAQLQCAACHKQAAGVTLQEPKRFRFTGLKADCLSCHKDYHRFGGLAPKKLGKLNQCLSCHVESKWDETHRFNHSIHTRFPIEGKHVPLDCNACHVPKERKPSLTLTPNTPVYHWNALEKATCEVCHRSPHNNEAGRAFREKKCSQCHTAEGWHVFGQSGKKFDHDSTRFRLTGKHAQVTCSACHVVGKKEVFRFPHVEEKFCIDCHKTPHSDQFDAAFSAKSCTECHTTVSFSERLPFDHGSTHFPLKGKHASVKCQECHKQTEERFDPPSTRNKSQFLFPDLGRKTCTQCHTDVHLGQLGQQCASCHNETGWRSLTFDHNKQSRFPITGKHVEVKCGECHKPVPDAFVKVGERQRPVYRFKPISPACTSCHKDPHQGHFGARCQECHMDKGWKLTKDFHRNFTLSGVHYSLQCQECHRDNRQLAGMSQECILCHQKDDIHEGTLPKCGKCHKQQFWEDADFKHSLSRFPLRGAHRTLECAACHARGIYQGTPSQCIDCHLAQAQTSSVHPNLVPNFLSCTNCHNQFSW